MPEIPQLSPIYKLPFLKKIPTRKRGLFLVSFLLIIVPLSLMTYLFWGLPFPTQITSESKNPVSTQILDRNGKLIYEIFEEKRRTPIKLSDLPPYVAQATIAIEDAEFYKHHGLSLKGIGRALFKTTVKQDLQGGSTITQQLVKTTLLTPERTVKRKVREILLTLIIETIHSKDNILTMYLNNVPYGGTAWGIESASLTYFGKSGRELTLGEASLLAGLPQAPTKFSPFGANPQLAKDRQALVLDRMVAEKYITPEEAENAKKEDLKLSKLEGLKAPHFALYVKERLVEKYGEDLVERGGLRVTTTLDLDLQEFAQKQVAEEVGKLKKANVGNGASIVINPKTGEIYAMVGSKDYFAEDEDGKVNVTLRSRQPGSSIKPLNYALAVEKGRVTAATTFADIPTCFGVVGQEVYCPVNYDNTFHGAIQTRFALGNSYNIPAVKTIALNRVEDFVGFANKMGLTTLTDPSRYGLSLTLGGGEVRMIDMVEAFGVFANSGIKQDPVSILKIEDWKGHLLEETQIKEGDRVLSTGTSYIISHILLDNNARESAFGTSSLLNVGGHPEVSVKTGTTNDRRDNWTLGFTPEVVVGVWVGNNNNEPMSAVASGVTGASPIWNKIMKEALTKIEAGGISGHGQDREKHEHVWMPKPGDVVGTNICSTTGTLPSGPEENPGCPTRFEFFLEEFPPQPSPPLGRQVAIFKDTGMLAPPDATPEQIETQERQVLEDPLGGLVCFECPIQTWSTTINISKRF
ncbi:MAG: hypothetical protein A2700_00015 [Candidatus Blackburnbacteria bacterium RIFCSPHIGHO2_01_FULL_44_64]|uniref:Uncharacterized protein n=1 Tax=Candidatus Blackburnbacteria bacterium RIFCSPHIGHO2_02_FULL_44_20 TaxID=1797516 RepID=A0A1G1V8G2_9BACT|nr:MAG: hypothetical protein A2700_00015 [Candidatus Blackburnbacteria bacterium RIFCSPHIGHO2_01_FULL_44_64]OGY11568.1 MAG: hypothetical protein A3E16_04440 [Candidatus Blackburnbacteria bacterium RIFCSPHIGHO2_12_FULL_44_25]OGY11666.1 MAG: hypothetical protein A3D26_00955 [Candidatus Blackburnbacteria bacterium RIFCSPHIGHO2_02_FULL_44_20]OGY13960.1 MAG: hypothetical protein A3A62_01215 [Candidatus Blackburnbacteria bacterium RIFCSPLOWO2_01_FULL_44_43]OGY16310.1 MAG: hypothetical protein A3H88_0